MSATPYKGEPTSFQEIYDRFLSQITDDMYVEWTEEDTKRDLLNIFISSVTGFEFPRFPLYDYDIEAGEYNCHLTSEEVQILALLMYNTWLQRQIASIENTRQKFSGTDFKMTSQANHLAKLIELKKEAERQCFHSQRLYKRRKADKEGIQRSEMSTLMERSVFDG